MLSGESIKPIIDLDFGRCWTEFKEVRFVILRPSMVSNIKWKACYATRYFESNMTQTLDCFALVYWFSARATSANFN